MQFWTKYDTYSRNIETIHAARYLKRNFTDIKPDENGDKGESVRNERTLITYMLSAAGPIQWLDRTQPATHRRLPAHIDGA